MERNKSLEIWVLLVELVLALLSLLLAPEAASLHNKLSLEDDDKNKNSNENNHDDDGNNGSQEKSHLKSSFLALFLYLFFY